MIGFLFLIVEKQQCCGNLKKNQTLGYFTSYLEIISKIRNQPLLHEFRQKLSPGYECIRNNTYRQISVLYCYNERVKHLSTSLLVYDSSQF